MNRRSFGATALLSFGLMLSASGHEIGPANLSELSEWWAFEPGTVVPLILSGFLYALGVYRLRSASNAVFGLMEIICFAAGWNTLAIALVSPLHPWGAVLFSAHMTQHELLMLVAAPLLVLGRPLIPLLWALPRSTARQLAGWGNADKEIEIEVQASGSSMPLFSGPGICRFFFRRRATAR